MMSIDDHGRRFASRRDAGVHRIVHCVVVAVRFEHRQIDRPRQIVTLIEVENRTVIANAIVATWEGRSWCAEPAQLSPTTQNLVTGTVYPEGVADRLAEMADGAEPPEGWDGDHVLVAMVGRQAVVIGCLRHPFASTDVATAATIDDPADPSYMAPGTTLAESPWTTGDELPVALTTGHPDGRPGRWGRVLTTAWRDVGFVLEVRPLDGDDVAARAATHTEATEARLFARSPTVRIEAGQVGADGWVPSNWVLLADGTGLTAETEAVELDVSDGTTARAGLQIGLSTPSDTDLTAEYMPVCRHNTTKVVIDTMRAQISELQAQLNAAIAALNTLQAQTAALQVATAAIVLTPAGVLTNGTAAAAIAVSPVTPVMAPAPTDAQVLAMRSAAVRAGA